jgi:regulator of RNase E activity RraB
VKRGALILIALLLAALAAWLAARATRRPDVKREDEDDQRRMNRRTLAALRDAGDGLEAPRDVHHWIYFDRAEDRTAFEASAKKRGFSVVAERKHDDGAAGSLGLEIAREDRVDEGSIDALTIELRHFAGDVGGEYDGWESPVIKSKPAK